MEVDGKTVKLEIWDTAGQERYRRIASSYYRDIHGIILAFDVTNEKSFENINKWLEEIDQQATDALNVLLVGNKCDLTYDRLVGHETAKKLADSLNIPYIETSAKNSTNVEQAFQTLTSGIISILAPIKAKSSATNDQAETKPIESNFYKGVDGFIVLFDLTKVESFENIKMWFQLIDQNADKNVKKLLVGNKSDLTTARIVDCEIAQKLANSLNIPYVETSSKDSTNVEQAFDILATDVMSRFAPSKSHQLETASLQSTITTKCEPKYLIKLLLIGDSGVGKSSLLLRFTNNSFDESFIPTIGVDFAVRTIQWHGQTAKLSIDDVFYESYLATIGVDFKIRKMNHNGKTVKLQMWDTAGDERFRTITSNSLVINVIGSY
ncbi:unnamed protein product [Rotaria sp. Silwood1]|nr:unnamed protein product [Rotaria sp. Silwood1]